MILPVQRRRGIPGSIVIVPVALVLVLACDRAKEVVFDPCESKECGPECGACPGETDYCTEDGRCVDDCLGRECGPSPNVEISCGTCPGQTEYCTQTGECVDDCSGRICGSSPTMGYGCGTCPGSTEYCTGAGACADDCAGRSCGASPLHGFDCGTCPGSTDYCTPEGACVDDCAGRVCGLSPNAGLDCGSCAGSTEYCNGDGHCVDDCAGLECGLSPNQGFDCGTYSQNRTCIAGACKYRPNAKYMTFYCEKKNIGGLVLDNVRVNCVARLADRYSNDIDYAATVFFRTEAGTITSQAQTVASGPDQGSATGILTTGNPRPIDVAPFLGEPFRFENAVEYNPRDGLVTIIAVVNGEEEFNDINANDMYDPGEPFVDLGEPFIDADDDGICDQQFESYIDVNGNGYYDLPNAFYDTNTLIWKQTQILWTGNVVLDNPDTGCSFARENRYSIICPSSFDIPKGGSQVFEWFVRDINLNPLNETCTIDAAVVGKGSLGLCNPELPFQATDITGISGIQFSNEWAGNMLVHGADAGDVTLPEDGTVRVMVNYRDTPGAGSNHSETMSVSGIFQ